MATTIWPELTTVRQPVAEMSRLALEMLVSRVKALRSRKTLPVEHRLLDFALVRRHSDAAPRRRQPVERGRRG
jgi:LacI family transcriptional regulator